MNLFQGTFEHDNVADAYLKPNHPTVNNNKVSKRMRFETEGMFQPTPNFKSFKRVLGHQLTGSETYHGVEQPEPEPEPMLPVTGEVDREWEREMYRWVLILLWSPMSMDIYKGQLIN